MKPIFNDFTVTFQAINSRGKDNSLRLLLGESHFHTNIIFSDMKRHNRLVLYISKSKQKFYPGFSSYAGFSVIGPSSVWREILKGNKSLTAALAEGSLTVPNLRVNWPKLVKLSFLFSSITQKIENFE